MSITQEAEAVAFEASGVAVIDANGCGTICFTPADGEHLTVTRVRVRTNQDENATVVPLATIVKNTTDVAALWGNLSFGASRTGNDDTWTGITEIGPGEILSVMFYPPSVQPDEASVLAGVIASAKITGTKRAVTE